MQQQEREWVATLLVELRAIGMPDVASHYLEILTRMDEDLLREYRKCVRIFNLEQPSREKSR
jgi:hypothetical protein